MSTTTTAVRPAGTYRAGASGSAGVNKEVKAFPEQQNRRSREAVEAGSGRDTDTARYEVTSKLAALHLLSERLGLSLL